MHFDVVQGDIARQTAHAIVNTTGEDVAMECGVAGALRQRSNGPLADLVAEHRPLERGDIVVTEAFDLPAEYLLHTVTFAGEGDATAGDIRSATQNVLERADDLNCRSIVVPLLGCGGGGYDLADGAACIYEEIAAFNPESLADVRVIYHAEGDYERLADVARDVKAEYERPEEPPLAR